MKTIIGLATALALTSGAALAQDALKPDTPSILAWSPEQQSLGYRTIEHFYKVNTIARGAQVRPLVMAARQIDSTVFTSSPRAPSRLIDWMASVD